MVTAQLQIDLPARLAEAIMLDRWQEEDRLLCKALLVYPYIVNKKVSFSSAANMLELSRPNLMAIYDKLGLPYIHLENDMIDDEMVMLAAIKHAEEKCDAGSI